MEVRNRDTAIRVFKAWLEEQGRKIPAKVDAHFVQEPKDQNPGLFVVETEGPVSFYKVTMDGQVTKLI